MEFTPELLCAALEKYVFKTRLTDRDKEYVKGLEDDTDFDPEETLKYLIENSEGRLDIYAPTDKFLQNLESLVDFPNNSQYLGICKDRMNFEDTYRVYKDNKKSKFLLKSEVLFFLNSKLDHEDAISTFILESYGHKLYSMLKKTLEFIPQNIVENMFEKICKDVQNLPSNETHQINENNCMFFQKTVTDVSSWLCECYDSEEDKKFLTEILKQLEITSHSLPVKFKINYYQKMLLRCQYIEKFMKLALKEFDFIFKPNPKNDKNFPHFPVIRVFECKKNKFLLVKDLEFALINYVNVRIQVEKSEERRNGIVSTIEYQELRRILKQAGITENDLNIIPTTIKKTKHDVNVPILTSYGTHCKLAGDAFREVFRVFSLDLNWFNTVSQINYFKFANWFNSQSDVFNDTREEVYFIEVWKIEELKNQVYEEMKKYTRKPNYNPPNKVRFLTKEQMYDEMKNFGSSIQMDDECWKKLWLDTKSERNMSKWDVLTLYSMQIDNLQLGGFHIAKFVSTHVGRVGIHFSGEIGSARSMVITASKVQDVLITHPPQFYNKLDAHQIGFLNEYAYSMSTMNCECFYGNDICLKLALDKTIVEESVKSKIVSLVYEAEIRKYENGRRSVFYLTESEFHTFCETTRKKFSQMMDSTPPIDFFSKSCATEEEKREEIKCAEKMRSFNDYCRDNKERTIVMRIMCEMRMDHFEDWHIFSEEALDAVEIVLENEGKLDIIKERIDKWRKKWCIEKTLTTVTVAKFKTILAVVGIDLSKFVFIPDTQFFKQYIKLPLKMGYCAMKILSPDARNVYHQVQAQFMLFQYGVCDVLWNCENKKEKSKQKKKVLDEMRKLGKDYTLAETVEESVRRVMNSDVAQKTYLSSIHGKMYNDPLTKDEIQRFNQFLSKVRFKKGAAYQCKSFFMVWTLENFFKNNVDEELRRNIHKAFTISFGFVYIIDHKHFDEVYKVALEKGFETFFASIISMTNGNADKGLDKFMNGLPIEKLEYMISQMMKAISITHFKNESAQTAYDEKELVGEHYLFDESDPLGALGRRKELNKIEAKVVKSKSGEIFESLDEVCSKVMVDYIKNEYDEDEAYKLCKAIKTAGGGLTKLKLSDFLNASKRKVDDSRKRVKLRQEESPKVIIKYVTETKTVENCVQCRNIEKETMAFLKKIENFGIENEKNQKLIRQHEEDLTMLKSQISQNKLKYREEIQKHKEDVECREAKIEQLNQEIKEYRDDSKVEREKLYEEVRMSSKKADESVKKMKIELENAKFRETANNKKFDELIAEISHLKTSLELCEEHLEASESARENAENGLNTLKNQINEMAFSFEDVAAEEDLYLSPEINIGIFDELLRFDAYGILNKIGNISDFYGIPNSEIVRFGRRYDMYIRIVENENCWESAEIPEFPISFSADFMQTYESCLKGNVMAYNTLC